LISIDGTPFELVEGENLIGRGGREYNDPPKIDVGPLQGGATVSRHHARVLHNAGKWILRVEPESRNETRVGGRVIPKGEEVALPDEAPLQFGDVMLTFRAIAEAVRAQSPDQTMADEVMPATTSEPAPEPPPKIVVPPPPTPQPEPVKVAEAKPDGKPPTAAWPGRLPSRPETLVALGVSEFKRVNPFRGLMIDESAWADAHDYHRLIARLHLLVGHGWGIVEGLEVIADDRIPNTIVIRPGIAVDVQGHALLIAQERRLPISAPNGTTLYVAARLHEEMTSPQRFWNDLDEYTRIVERCETQIVTTPPVEPTMELARFTVDGPIRNAVDVLDPKPGEIDLRYREHLLVRPRPDVAIAQLIVDEADGTENGKADGQGASKSGGARNHLLGLRHLLREIAQTTAYRPRWAGVVRPGDALPQVSLLYAGGTRGFSLADASQSPLRAFLDNGGVILFDSCAEAKGDEFIRSVQDLAKALGRELKPVTRWHPLLTARHVFAQPPLETDKQALLEGDGIILSVADYGCAWVGGREDKPLAREAIRSALELGVNAAVYARRRQRPLEAVDLEA
jgi:hypothetical protein